MGLYFLYLKLIQILISMYIKVYEFISHITHRSVIAIFPQIDMNKMI